LLGTGTGIQLADGLARGGFVTRIDFQDVTAPIDITYSMVVEGSLIGENELAEAHVIAWSPGDPYPACIWDTELCFLNGSGTEQQPGNWASVFCQIDPFDPVPTLEIIFDADGTGSGLALGGVNQTMITVNVTVTPEKPSVMLSSFLGVEPNVVDGIVDFFNTAKARLSVPDGVTYTSPNGYLSVESAGPPPPRLIDTGTVGGHATWTAVSREAGTPRFHAHVHRAMDGGEVVTIDLGIDRCVSAAGLYDSNPDANAKLVTLCINNGLVPVARTYSLPGGALFARPMFWPRAGT
jgi:hypothetical protein